MQNWTWFLNIVCHLNLLDAHAPRRSRNTGLGIYKSCHGWQSFRSGVWDSEPSMNVTCGRRSAHARVGWDRGTPVLQFHPLPAVIYFISVLSLGPPAPCLLDPPVWVHLPGLSPVSFCWEITLSDLKIPHCFTYYQSFLFVFFLLFLKNLFEELQKFLQEMNSD